MSDKRLIINTTAIPLILVLLAVFLAGSPEQPWTSPSVSNPLGTDEFGRDILSTVIIATGLSFLKGMVMTGFLLLFSIIVAEIITLSRSAILSSGVRMVTRIIESIPVVLWVLIVVVALKELPRPTVTGFAFILVLLPSSVTIIAGELQRLRHIPFVEAAYLLGVPEPKVLFHHIIPNMGAVMLPFAIQVLGGAVAIDGAVGVIGLGSRVDLDLGVFLIRGKENFLFHPQLLLVSILMYATIYGYLITLSQTFRRFNGSVEAAR